MLRLSWILYLILFGCQVKGQFNSAAEHFGKQLAFNVVSINSKSYYLISSTTVPSCCDDSVFIISKDQNGKELFRRFIELQSYMEYGKVVKTTDHHLIVFTGTDLTNCDFGTTYFKVCKLDTLGKIVWSFTTAGKLIDLEPCANNSFILFRPDSFLLYNTNGVIVSRVVAAGIHNLQQV